MDHSEAPVLDALAAYHDHGYVRFTPPGRGVDPRVRAVLGEEMFRSDVLAVAGLDDRTSSDTVLERAQELMADAVGAEQTFFSADPFRRTADLGRAVLGFRAGPGPSSGG